MSATTKATQAEKAQALVASGRIAFHRDGAAGRVYRVTGSQGDTYWTTYQSCSCPAGVALRRCHHSVAAQMMDGLAAGAASSPRIGSAQPK